MVKEGVGIGGVVELSEGGICDVELDGVRADEEPD